MSRIVSTTIGRDKPLTVRDLQENRRQETQDREKYISERESSQRP